MSFYHRKFSIVGLYIIMLIGKYYMRTVYTRTPLSLNTKLMIGKLSPILKARKSFHFFTQYIDLSIKIYSILTRNYHVLNLLIAEV